MASHFFSLDNGVMETPKRRLFAFIFACIKKNNIKNKKWNGLLSMVKQLYNTALCGFLLQLLWCSSECELVWPNDHRIAVYIVQRARHVN